jgi:hypothetical protein
MLAAHWYWNSDLLKTLLRAGARKDIRDRPARTACDHMGIANQQYPNHKVMQRLAHCSADQGRNALSIALAIS